MFKKAKREQSKLRLALIGPSGSGKTYSALLIAKGLGGSIAMIDTERGSGNLYSDLTDYDICELEPPFSPERYIQAIQEAEKAGYEIIIVDSLSHAWAGPGGILEFVDKASQSQKNNFAAWREASPKHNALVDALVQSKAHVIGTMRSKTQWEVQKDEKSGKTKPVKIGLAPVQREGLEYEFTSVLEISVEGHVASASKDRTSLFDGQYFVPSTETGELLKSWLAGNPDDGGNGTTRQVQATTEQEGHEPHAGAQMEDDQEKPSQNRSSLLTEIFNALRELQLAGMINQYERYLIGKYGKGIKDLDVEQLNHQLANLEKCKQDSELCEKFKAYLSRLDEAEAA